MFRRKDELLDADAADTSAQGSLLAGSNDTVNVLSPQQAVQYQSTQSPANSAPAANASAPAAVAIPAVSPSSHFGQIARPIQPESSRNTSSTTSAFRPASATGLSQPVNDTRRAERPTFPSVSPSRGDGRRVLTVGNEILLKGEITACDRLVIEGKVDATVKEVHTLELAESGSFKGFAEVEYAEISGKFEGELIVKSALVIYSSGTISGKITYGEIEIQRGGELTGEIQTFATKGATSTRKNKEAA